MVGARPDSDHKKGTDAGIDGYINFFDDTSGKPKRIVVQVRSDIEHEKADLALLVTLKPPTQPGPSRLRLPPPHYGAVTTRFGGFELTCRISDTRAALTATNCAFAASSPAIYETSRSVWQQSPPPLSPIGASPKRQKRIPEYLEADEMNAIIKAAPNPKAKLLMLEQ